jgi:hypothetical protein
MTFADFCTSYDEELKELWGNKRFADPIAATVYEGTNRKLQDSPVIESKTFLQCPVEHSKCNGQIITDSYTHRCYCPCHRFFEIREFF